MGNFVTLRLFLFMFCISFPRSGSQIEAVLLLSVHSNSCTDIHCLRIFKYYKKQYSNADRQKGIQIILIFEYSSHAGLFDMYVLFLNTFLHAQIFVYIIMILSKT